jgi:hypothetical protein
VSYSASKGIGIGDCDCDPTSFMGRLARLAFCRSFVYRLNVSPDLCVHLLFHSSKSIADRVYPGCMFFIEFSRTENYLQYAQSILRYSLAAISFVVTIIWPERQTCWW